MMRRTELKRWGGPARMTPMKRVSPSLRCSGLNPVSKKRAAVNRERTKALRPLREAQTWCSRCGVSGVGLDAHELLSRARGGSITDLDNIVLLCRSCHDLITTSPALAETEGWSRTAGAA